MSKVIRTPRELFNRKVCCIGYPLQGFLPQASQWVSAYINRKVLIYDGDVVIPLVFGLKNTQIEVLVIFDEDCHTAAVRVFDFVKFNESQYEKALLACNEINSKKRWAKFYIQGKNKVCIDADMMFNLDDAGDNVLEVVIRLCSIADEAYRIIQRAIWS